jgi:hypothetical protein
MMDLCRGLTRFQVFQGCLHHPLACRQDKALLVVFLLLDKACPFLLFLQMAKDHRICPKACHFRRLVASRVASPRSLQVVPQADSHLISKDLLVDYRPCLVNKTALSLVVPAFIWRLHHLV